VVLQLVPGGWVDPRTAALDARLDDILARAEALNERLAASDQIQAATAEPRAREWTPVEREDVEPSAPIQADLFFARSDPRLRKEIERFAREHGLRDYTEALLAVARRAIHFRTTEPDDGKTVGRTRFGGAPDVAPDFDYPMSQGEHWSFMAQVNLAEIAPLQGYLPREGLLSFFCRDPNHYFEESKVVLFPDVGSLMRYEYPEDVEFSDEMRSWEGKPYPAHVVEPELVISLPYLYSDGDRLEGVARRLLEIEEKGLPTEYEKVRQALARTRDGEPLHLMNGYVFTQHESPGEQAAHVHGGHHDEWMVLLSFDSDGKVGFGFWDAGTLTFSVHKKDVAIGEFETVVVTLESS
jgi:uncharacterized protein YwqG